MIGIFDSGVGGLCAFLELRRILPREEMIYLSDRRNAPYGTKTKDELLALEKKDIKRLADMGADKILIACCTASTLWNELDDSEKEITVPIIRPAARIAARGRRVAVIATKHTVKAAAFSREIWRFNQSAFVSERAEQDLVALVEDGNRDGKLNGKTLARLWDVARWTEKIQADVLVLGCTHFSHLEGTLMKMMPEVKIVSPAREGAREIAKTAGGGCRGKITYTDATALGIKAE